MRRQLRDGRRVRLFLSPVFLEDCLPLKRGIAMEFQSSASGFGVAFFYGFCDCVRMYLYEGMGEVNM